MPERTAYADGEPCWADLTTPDLAASRTFYGSLFGWTFRDSGAEFGHYTMCQLGEANVAAITPPMSSSATSSGSAGGAQPAGSAGSGGPAEPPPPPMWSVYLASSDVDLTAQLAEEAGAKILMGPMDVPGSGRMLYGFDPTGAAFGVWQAGRHIGAQLFGEPGTMCWAEVNTRDGEAADAFYASLFPYEQEQIGDGTSFDYTAWSLDGEMVCGRMQLTDDFPTDVPPHWMVYFAVEDTDEAVAAIGDLGGMVRMPAQDSPYGRFAVLADPHGATFAIISPARP